LWLKDKNYIENTVNKIYSALTYGDMEYIDQVFAEDLRYVACTNTVFNKKEFMSSLPSIKDAFPDEKFNVDRVTIQDNRAVVEYTWTATHLREYQGFPATNNRIVMPVIDVLEFESGKVKVFKDIFNWKIFEKGYNPDA
jgi:steroid delta-isomerase-like uncharacterized protein